MLLLLLLTLKLSSSSSSSSSSSFSLASSFLSFWSLLAENIETKTSNVNKRLILHNSETIKKIFFNFLTCVFIFIKFVDVSR